MLKIGRHVRGAEVERILQRDVAVDDLDRLNLNRTVRAGAFLFPRLAFDERAEIPASIRQLRPHDVRARQTDAAHDGPAIDELANAVGERDFVNVDQGAVAAREVDVAELQPPEERALEAADRQRRRQVLVRLADDQIANAVLRPARFNRRDADADEGEHERDQNDQRLRKPCRHGSQTSESRHQTRWYVKALAGP